VIKQLRKHSTKLIISRPCSTSLPLWQNVHTHQVDSTDCILIEHVDVFRSGLTAHSQILANLFLIAEQGLIKVRLAPEVKEPEQNLLYVQQFMANLLKNAFPHLQDHQVKVIIEGFVTLDQDIAGFKEHLRDFLVQIREATGNDVTDLYLEDREQTLTRAAEEKRKIQMSVPGTSSSCYCSMIALIF
jgi:hypothetical protein